jgi:hypothetical protein
MRPDHYRRPKNTALRTLYDAGVAAASENTEDPFQPPTERGDDIRSHLWNQGREDQAELLAVTALV